MLWQCSAVIMTMLVHCYVVTLTLLMTMLCNGVDDDGANVMTMQ